MSIVGSQNYSSPDLIYNKQKKLNDHPIPVDWKKNDIFSLGLTFLEVLTLQSVKNLNTSLNAIS